VSPLKNRGIKGGKVMGWTDPFARLRYPAFRSVPCTTPILSGFFTFSPRVRARANTSVLTHPNFRQLAPKRSHGSRLRIHTSSTITARVYPDLLKPLWTPRCNVLQRRMGHFGTRSRAEI
jgi:hypothetical protein